MKLSLSSEAGKTSERAWVVTLTWGGSSTHNFKSEIGGFSIWFHFTGPKVLLSSSILLITRYGMDKVFESLVAVKSCCLVAESSGSAIVIRLYFTLHTSRAAHTYRTWQHPLSSARPEVKLGERVKVMGTEREWKFHANKRFSASWCWDFPSLLQLTLLLNVERENKVF